MKNYFNIEEFFIDLSYGMPISVVNKIITHHLPILNSIRDKLGEPVIISQKSGYRPKGYEIDQGRSGNSEHTFSGLGAVDITTNGDFDELVHQAMSSKYTRVCVYYDKKFIHCDFKGTDKQRFRNTDKGWELI